MRIYAATKNAGKLRELAEMFAAHGIEIAAWPQYQEPEETGGTYAANAAIKAHALREQLSAAGVSAAVLADDSGLEIAALGGRPGVHSARYGGPGATWASRRASLLREVAASGSEDRRARFVCMICYVGEDGSELFAQGVADGELSRNERGELGFSYDPIFFDPSEHATYAELSEKKKNAVSHRGKAVYDLIEKLALKKR